SPRKNQGLGWATKPPNPINRGALPFIQVTCTAPVVTVLSKPGVILPQVGQLRVPAAFARSCIGDR
ncbi:MAG: hypothetical protein ACO4AI_07050, partial [Prochlorothrix sp.]